MRRREGRRVHRLARASAPRRIAVLSVHTSPLDAPGGGDAGGMNVYVVESAKRLADRGVAVEIFTRATAGDQPPSVELHPGVLVRHVTAGPLEGLPKGDLPSQLCAFTAGVLRTEAFHEPGWYDAIHSHYWLSGQVGWLARERWGVPLIHSAHTLAKVKNAMLAAGDAPEPRARVIGEEQVVAEADRLVASTAEEADDLIRRYGADPGRVRTVAPGVDLEMFRPGDRHAARRRLGLRPGVPTLLFVGRIQPLKAPDVLLRAAAQLAPRHPQLQVVVVGAPSGSDPAWLPSLARTLGLDVRFIPTAKRDTVADYYRAADLTVVPSYNESFGLVALESQACGTPVVAASVGGLRTAVADGTSGVLVAGHRVAAWTHALDDLLTDDGRRKALAAGARSHAMRFSWERTTSGLLAAYEEAIADLRQLAVAT